MNKNKKAQITLETSVLIAIIAAALLGVSVYMKRAFQGKLKGSADSVGGQYSSTLANSNSMFSSDSMSIKTSELYNAGTLYEYSYYETVRKEKSNEAEVQQIQGYDREPIF